MRKVFVCEAFVVMHLCCDPETRKLLFLWIPLVAFVRHFLPRLRVELHLSAMNASCLDFGGVQSWGLRAAHVARVEDLDDVRRVCAQRAAWQDIHELHQDDLTC